MLAKAFRESAQDTRPDRQWLLFDGPVDAVRLESQRVRHQSIKGTLSPAWLKSHALAVLLLVVVLPSDVDRKHEHRPG